MLTDLSLSSLIDDFFCWRRARSAPLVLDTAHDTVLSNKPRLPLILISTISKVNSFAVPSYKFIVRDMIFLTIFFQIGDLKGFFGLFMVQLQQLQKKLKVLDFTY
jgi:hypothetical protein